MDYVAMLQAKRSEVAGEIESLRTEQRRLADTIATREAQLRNLDELLAIEGVTDAPVEPRTTRSLPPRGPSQGFLDEAAGVIREAGEPVYYQDLVLRLRDRGIEVPGRDPAANLIAHMGRDDRFVRTGRGTYGLSDLHEPAVPVVRRVARAGRSRKGTS